MFVDMAWLPVSLTPEGFRTDWQWWFIGKYFTGHSKWQDELRVKFLETNRVMAACPSLEIKINQCQALYDIARQYNTFQNGTQWVFSTP